MTLEDEIRKQLNRLTSPSFIDNSTDKQVLLDSSTYEVDDAVLEDVVGELKQMFRRRLLEGKDED